MGVSLLSGSLAAVACGDSWQFVPPINSVGLRKASMVVRIRMLLLLIVAALYPAQSASACPGCLLLSPFRWLFGCDHYSGCGLGSGHDCNRFIDDWFGYGYLRGQQGTLGHYPGNWYRQPQLLHGHGMHGGRAMVGGYGMGQPMMMPAPMTMPAQMTMPMPAPMPMVQPGIYGLPAGGMYSASWDPCCDPCGDPCGGMGGSYGVATPMPMYEGSSGSDCGCAGGGATVMPPAVPPAGMLSPPHTTAQGWIEPQLGWHQPPMQPFYQHHVSQWPVPAWQPQGSWQPMASVQPMATPQSWQPQVVYSPPAYSPPVYGQQVYGQPVYGQPVYGQAQVAAMTPAAWRSASIPQATAGMQSAQVWQSSAAVPQAMPGVAQAVPHWQHSGLQPQYQPHPQPQWQGAGSWQPVVGGVVSAGISPVSQSNSFGSSRLPLRRVSMASPPLGSAGARSYPNALR